MTCQSSGVHSTLKFIESVSNICVMVIDKLEPPQCPVRRCLLIYGPLKPSKAEQYSFKRMQSIGGHLIRMNTNESFYTCYFYSSASAFHNFQLPISESLPVLNIKIISEKIFLFQCLRLSDKDLERCPLKVKRTFPFCWNTFSLSLFITVWMLGL